MRVVAIADTHANSIEEFPTALLDSLREADMIIHAGDYTSKVVLDQLKEISSFKGVCGNMDPPEIRLELPEKTVFDVEGRKIGVVHPVEGGAPFGIQKRIRKEFERVDLIVYGHTHSAKREQKGEVLFVNPGTAAGMWPARGKTFAIMEINRTIEARIVQIP